MVVQVYASYGARYEGRIVQELIKADGGSGSYDERALPMLGIWNTLLEVQQTLKILTCVTLELLQTSAYWQADLWL